MTSENRREFLKQLARGAAYVAPVVISVAAPPGLAGQGKSSQHKPGGGANLQAAPGQQPGESLGGPPPGGPPPGQPPRP